jgi:hypothetical protein
MSFAPWAETLVASAVPTATTVIVMGSPDNL